ncbi:tetratricopeptide repeat protein [Acidobacteriota bacterium]
MMSFRSIHRSIIAFLVILSCAVVLDAQQGRGQGRINGTVMDAAGNPVEGAVIVAVHREFGTRFEGKTDRKGRWAIAGLGTGDFHITAAKEGYGEAGHDMRVSQFSRNNPPIAFTLQPDRAAGSSIPEVENRDTLVIFKEGNRLFGEGKFQEAAEKFGEFLVQNPAIFQVNINIGNCYSEIGDFEKAIFFFQQALDMVMEEQGTFEGSESAARALTGIGEIYVKKGELEKAGGFLKQALDISPKDEILAFNIGEIFFNQGDTDSAIAYYKKAQEIRSDWSRPFKRLGYAYLNKGEYVLSLESFKVFLEKTPDDPEAKTVSDLLPQIEKLIKK